MNILITGGFGNIGISVINECLNRGHSVTVFDLESKRAKKLSKKYSKKKVKSIFGDIRKIDDINNAIKNQDAIIHLAAILPPLSDKNPKLCTEVNVTGIENILNSIKSEGNKTALIEVSSASVMGATQSKEPPVKPTDSVIATDTYSQTKIQAESLVEASGVRFCILRLAAVLPTNISFSYFLNMIKVMFDMPLKARCEIVLDLDVAHALVSAAENLVTTNSLNKAKGFIAGGKTNGCQLTNDEMLKSVFKQIGLTFPQENLFSDNINNYYLDWYDTDEIQKSLQFQNHTFDQWKKIIKKRLALYAGAIYLFRKPILKWLEQLSQKYKS